MTPQGMTTAAFQQATATHLQGKTTPLQETAATSFQRKTRSAALQWTIRSEPFKGATTLYHQGMLTTPFQGISATALQGTTPTTLQGKERSLPFRGVTTPLQGTKATTFQGTTPTTLQGATRSVPMRQCQHILKEQQNLFKGWQQQQLKRQQKRHFRDRE